MGTEAYHDALKKSQRINVTSVGKVGLGLNRHFLHNLQSMLAGIPNVVPDLQRQNDAALACPPRPLDRIAVNQEAGSPEHNVIHIGHQVHGKRAMNGRVDGRFDVVNPFRDRSHISDVLFGGIVLAIAGAAIASSDNAPTVE